MTVPLKAVAAVAVALVAIAAIFLWPVKAEEVNEPDERTIAWVKLDAYFTVCSESQDFKELRVSKGEYVGDGTDLPTQSLWKSMSLKSGLYLWQIDFDITGPNGFSLSTNKTFKHDLPGSPGTIGDSCGVIYLSHAGSYAVTVSIRAVDYQVDATGEVLATGTGTFTIPDAWASGSVG